MYYKMKKHYERQYDLEQMMFNRGLLYEDINKKSSIEEVETVNLPPEGVK